MIAIPSLIKDLEGTGVTTEMAIANVVPKPGFTDFAIFIYDQNGLLDYVCQKLNEKQVEYIDLQTWGYINNGFKGSAIISAVFWEHDVFDGTGFFLRNLVGLGAVSVERSKTRLGEDIAGDEAAGSRGIPFRQSDIEDEEFEFGFMPEGRIPDCPGVPDLNPDADGDGGPQLMCPPDSISGAMTQGSPDWSDYESYGPFASRIYRDGVAGQCGPPKACPGILGGGGNIDVYYLDNPGGGEVCVNIGWVGGSCAGSFDAMMYMFSGRYVPPASGWDSNCEPEPGVVFMNDSGSSGGAAFAGTLPAGNEHWSMIVADVFGATQCTYEFTISGFPCQ